MRKLLSNGLIKHQNMRMQVPFLTERYFKDLSNEDLFNKNYIRKLISSSKPPGHTLKAMRGFYHGEVVRSAVKEAENGGKTKYKKTPPVHKRVYYSKILDHTIKVNCTGKAQEEIDRAGGIDNYILVTPANEMCSMFGEYLRVVMLRKLNDPNLDVKNGAIFGTAADCFRKAPKKTQKAVYSKEWRHRDTTLFALRPVHEFTRRELKAIGELTSFPHNKDKIFRDHQVI